MAPQSVLCIWSRKLKAKLVVPVYFGTKTSEYWLRIISSSSLESELSFDSKDSEITAWSFESTLQYFKRRWGRPLCGRAACILGMDSWIRNGGAGKRKAGKKSQGLLWMVNLLVNIRFPRVPV